jgi:hypothetical protein
MRRQISAAILLSLLLTAALASVFALYAGSFQSAPAGAARRASNYLVANYNSSVGMIPEVPKGHTYYVYSDNFLAAYALAGSSDPTLRAIASNITSTDARMLSGVPHPASQYQVITSINASFFASNDYVLARPGSAVIETTLNNGTSPLNPSSYADVAFLEALYFHWTGDKQYAVAQFDRGAKLYDGRGFNDKAFSGGQYQTSKLALYDYVGKVLGAVLPSDLEDNLEKMQAPDGGFHTGYNSDLSTNGTATNTETTSLAILALSTPGAKAQPSPYLIPIFLSATAAVVAGEIVLMRRRSRRTLQKPWKWAAFSYRNNT